MDSDSEDTMDYMLHYEEDEWASNGEDSETSDPEIDYPDAS